MAKEVVVGTLNTLLPKILFRTKRLILADFHLGDELLGAVDDTRQA